MALPRILQRLEKLGYRVCELLDSLRWYLLTILVDHNHSMSGFSGRNSTITILEQSDSLCQRNAASAIPHQYDILTTQLQL
jgi:hypothetical protein